MNIVFMGTPDFAVPSLKMLDVYKRQGRRQKISIFNRNEKC